MPNDILKDARGAFDLARECEAQNRRAAAIRASALSR
jgi:hypothetical protein